MNWNWLITNFIAAWLLPPLNMLALGGIGLGLLPRHKHLGRALLALSLLGLTLLSTPFIGNHLLAALETPYQAIDSKAADAIVILGTGIYPRAPEFGGDTLSPASLERVRYGAYLHRLTGKPLLVAGGAPAGGTAEAQLMKTTLEQEFAVPVQWMEDRSDNTRENARNSATLLHASGITRIWLVSHAWHLRRAQPEFMHLGLQVIPAGTGYMLTRSTSPLDFLPSWKGLMHSAQAFHEGIGLIWYRIRN